jgi:pimeloyl-ACP methyl ester carboxylesterase
LSAGASAAPTAAARPGPLDVTGDIDGAPFRIIVPASWNGNLVVFAHGYDDKADHPGEVEVRGFFQRNTESTRAALLAQGWAIAGTAYKDNGWVVKDALEDLVALASHFRDAVATPDRTYLWGFSLGGLAALELAERNGGAFDGTIAACALGAGAPGFADWLLATMLAYDVTFGEPSSWGTPGDARDDIDFESDVLPILVGQLFDPANFGRFEFIRLVAGTPGRGQTPPLPPGLFPGWAFNSFFGATEGAAEAERRAGGPFMQNLTHTYGLTAAEAAYLALLGVDADPLLAAMNARSITASPRGRNYAEHYAGLSGMIKRPVLTLHTRIDWEVPASHESAYRETVAAAGRADLLTQAFTTGVGHCNFSAEQNIAALRALDTWVESGVPPTAASLPAGLGFDPSFVPPPWLQS